MSPDPTDRPPSPPVLTGSVVELHRIAPSDVDALLELWASDETVLDRWPRWTRADVEDLLAGEEGECGWWIVVDGERVGFVQHYQELDAEYLHAGMDIFLVAAAQGRGAGTDAIRTLARHLVHDLGHHRLVIDPAADNVRAIRCYEKVGFRPVGVMRKYELGRDDTWHDNLLMDLLADELT
jgi:aminoglycoside 6'-N-acetyltransferase